MSSWRDKRTKVVVRHLPPEWNEDTFRQVAGEWMDRCDWFRFVEGKDAMRKKDASEEPGSLGKVLRKRRRMVISFMGYSRAYLRFRGAENVRRFKEYFEAQAKSLLRNEQGNRAVEDERGNKDYSLDVVVQYAPYQTVSRDEEAAKRNTWRSSLESDVEFQAFKEDLLRGDGKGRDDGCTRKVSDGGRAVIQNSKSSQEVAEGKPKETALMKYVTQLHRKKAQEKASKIDGKKKFARHSRKDHVSGKQKTETKKNVLPKLSKKKQLNQGSGTTTKNEKNGEKSGAKGNHLGEAGTEKLQSKKKYEKIEKKDFQKRQGSTSSAESKSIVKQMQKNAAPSSRALKSPSKPSVSILQKPKEKHLISTSTVKSNSAHGGNKIKEVKFKILTKKEGDGNVEKRNQPQIPLEPSKTPEKSPATEAIKGNVPPRKGKATNNKEKDNKEDEGEASNQGKGRQRRRGPRQQKKTHAKVKPMQTTTSLHGL